MNRESESRLLDFCAHQHGAFQKADWLCSDLVDRAEMALVCEFLAQSFRYGHGSPLREAAAALEPGPLSFADRFRQHKFGCLRFSSLLGHRLQHAAKATF